MIACEVVVVISGLDWTACALADGDESGPVCCEVRPATVICRMLAPSELRIAWECIYVSHSIAQHRSRTPHVHEPQHRPHTTDISLHTPSTVSAVVNVGGLGSSVASSQSPTIGLPSLLAWNTVHATLSPAAQLKDRRQARFVCSTHYI